MSNNSIRPYDFGRVFFEDKSNPLPDRIYFQPLGNHVANVRRLVWLWELEYFPGNNREEKLESKKRVDEAARIHDIAKPQKFRLKVKDIKQGKFRQYEYSFAGHRYLAESSNKWAQYLAIGHHDFSVGDICRDAYKLKKEREDYDHILAKDPLTYARELYILEMCDQIEAELACRVIGNDEQAESRAFMDYTTVQLNNTTYLIDPWHFKAQKEKEILLPFAYWSMELSQADKEELEAELNKLDKLEKKLNQLVKKWWQKNKGKPEKETPKLIAIAPHKSVDSMQNWDVNTFYEKVTQSRFKPNPMQGEMWEAIAENPQPAVMLKSPTGSGKLEAVLFPSLAQNFRLILPLPARSLIDDQRGRIENYLKAFSQLPENQNREFSLVVDTGSQMYRWVYQNGEQVKRNINPRRHLYKGDVILTTIDKFLYRYFAFGGAQKSFIFPHRINREKTLICFDEAHSYEDVALANFSSLVESLYEAGRSLVLMTATMPRESREYFDYLETEIDYIDKDKNAEKLLQFQQKNLKQNSPGRDFEWLKDSKIEEIPKIVLSEWENAKENRRIIGVVESVKKAAEIYQKIKSQLGGNSDKKGERFLFLYHGRIDQNLRPEIYQKLKQRDDKNLPYILITTRAIEVGCDLNSEVLISEICPPENLIQRVGRCNRKGNIYDAKVIVIGNKIQPFVNTLDDDGLDNYKKTLQGMKEFNPLEIGGCISRSPQINDYRVVELFSMLHDYVYGADLTCQPLHEKGLIITRSWTPSATLVYDDGSHGDDINKMPQVSVGIDRLIIKESNKYANVKVCDRYYDKEETSWKLRPLTWGFAYHKNLFVFLNKSQDEEREYPYDPELGFVELPGVFIKFKSNTLEEKLLYKYEENGKQKSTVITYTKEFKNEN